MIRAPDNLYPLAPGVELNAQVQTSNAVSNSSLTLIDQILQLWRNQDYHTMVEKLIEFERGFTEPKLTAREARILQDALWKFPRDARLPDIDYGVYGRLRDKFSGVNFKLQVIGDRMQTCGDIPGYVWNSGFRMNFPIELFALVRPELIKYQSYENIQPLKTSYNWNIYSAVSKQTGKQVLIVNIQPNRSGSAEDFVRTLVLCLPWWQVIYTYTSCFIKIHRFAEVKQNSGIKMTAFDRYDMWKTYIETDYLSGGVDEELLNQSKEGIFLELTFAVLALRKIGSAGMIFAHLSEDDLFYYTDVQPRGYTVGGVKYLIPGPVHPLIVSTINLYRIDDPSRPPAHEYEFDLYLLPRSENFMNKLLVTDPDQVMRELLPKKYVVSEFPAGTKVYQQF